MDAKELMIGDLFKVNGYVTRIKDIVHLDKEGYYVVGCTTLNNKYIPVCYEPIPLTDAILAANGFEYHHKNFAALSYEHPFQLEMVEWPNEHGIGLWMVGGLIKIRFVHELQHAMRMAGLDIEIAI